MIFDAVILAGGRSSRLGGEPKAELEYDGKSLLAATIDAAAGARAIVVVGPGTSSGTTSLTVREDPPYSGPAAALAAGVAALEPGSEFVLVLACDLPLIGRVVPVLLATLAVSDDETGADGVRAADDSGRAQYLTAIYRTTAMNAAIARNSERLENLSMRMLLDGLDLRDARVPSETTHDVDTWADAAHYGITEPTEHRPQGSTR